MQCLHFGWDVIVCSINRKHSRRHTCVNLILFKGITRPAAKFHFSLFEVIV